MAELPSKRGRALSTAGLAVILVAAILWTVHVLRMQNGLQNAANWGQLVLVTIAISSIVTRIVTWRRPSALLAAEASHSARLGEAQRTLAALLLDQSKKEILARQLDDPSPLAVRWHLSELAVMDHDAIVGGPVNARTHFRRGARFSGRSDHAGEILAEFRKLARRRLVIIGDPGIGKTTLAVLLVREMLMRPLPDEPIPFLTSISDWNPSRESLNIWLAHVLTESYPALIADGFGTNMALELVNGGHILPVLDGLDEAPQDIRPQILSGINASLTADDPLILTCRTTEYQNAVTTPGGDVLTAGAVLEPSPLQLADARRYILNCVPPYAAGAWQAVLRSAALRQTPLAGALATPLNLWLIRKVYIDHQVDPTALLDVHRFPDEDAITGHLFDHLIEASIKSYNSRNYGGTKTRSHLFRRVNRTWKPHLAQRWLTFLATDLQYTELTNIRWWHLGRSLTNYNVRLVTGLLAGLASASVAVAGGWLVTSLVILLRDGMTPLLTDGLSVGIRLAPLSALLAGCSAFVATALAFGTPVSSRTIGVALPTVRHATRRAHALRRNFGSGLVCATACGLTAGLIGAAARGAAGALGYGVTGMLVGGLAGALPLASAANPVYVDLHLQRRIKSLMSDITSGLMSGLAIGFMIGVLAVVMTGLIEYVAEGPSASLSRYIVSGLGFGLTFGSLFGVTWGVNAWAMTPFREDSPETPALTLRRDTQRAIVLIIIVGIAFGLSLPLTLTAIFPLNVGLYSSIAIGATFGSVGGLVYGCSGASARYYVSVLLLWLRGSVPLRLMSFLADAHSMGLLRQVGAIYQFRHAKLQRHLAHAQPSRPDRSDANPSDAAIVIPP